MSARFESTDFHSSGEKTVPLGGEAARPIFGAFRPPLGGSRGSGIAIAPVLVYNRAAAWTPAHLRGICVGRDENRELECQLGQGAAAAPAGIPETGGARRAVPAGNQMPRRRFSAAGDRIARLSGRGAGAAHL